MMSALRQLRKTNQAVPYMILVEAILIFVQSAGEGQSQDTRAARHALLLEVRGAANAVLEHCATKPPIDAYLLFRHGRDAGTAKPTNTDSTHHGSE